MKINHDQFKKLLKETKKRILNEGIEDIYGLYVLNTGTRINLVLYNTIILKKLIQIFEGYIGPKNEEFFNFAIEKGGVVGYMYLWAPHEDECMNAWVVELSSINKQYQGKGIGKILYKLAMAIVYPNPIASDRDSVSDKASRVYKSMEKDSNVEKLPPNEEPYKGTFDNWRDPQTEPKDDDCDVISGRDELNKAYKDDEMESLVKKLENNNENFIKWMEEQENINKNFDFVSMGDRMFSAVYGK